MTVKAAIVNIGNRSGDRLWVTNHNLGQQDDGHLTTLARGESVEVPVGGQGVVSLVAMGEPKVNVDKRHEPKMKGE